MKKIICLIGILCALSCSKSEEPTSTNQTSNNPVSPNIPTLPSKNYLQTSYELQKSNVMVDLIKLRKDKLGIDNSWNILAFAYLDVNSDGNDDIFMICSYGKGERTKGDLFINKNGDYVVDNSYFEEIPSMVHARKVLIGDFNGDKMPDIFISGHGYDYPPFPGEYNQILLSNNKKYKLKTTPSTAKEIFKYYQEKIYYFINQKGISSSSLIIHFLFPPTFLKLAKRVDLYSGFSSELSKK